MSCAFDKEKLTAFFDGELAAAEKAEVERHIAACSECLRELGELKAAVTLVKTLPAVRAPRAIAEAVQRAVRPPARIHRWAQPMMWVSAAAAALFVVVNVVWLSQMETPTPVAAHKRSDAPAIAAAVPSADERRSAANSSAAPEPVVRRAREADAVEKAAAKEELAKGDGAVDRKALEAPKPAAAAKSAPAPAPKPEIPPATPAAPPPGAEAKRDDAAFAQKLQEEQKNRQEQAQSVYLATGDNSLRCQTVVEGWTARNNLQLRGQAQSRVGQGVASGGGGTKSPAKVSAGKDAVVPPEPMVVEVTDEELAALTKELAANGYRVSVATPAQNKLGYVDLPADKAAADAEKKKEGEAERALKAAAPTESGAVAKQQAGRAGARRITIYFVDQPAADKK